MSAPSPAPSTPVYTEKLRAPWWLWLFVAAVAVAIGLALSPANMALAGLIMAVAFVIGGVLLLASSPSIVVTQRTLKVGRAEIERRYLGDVTGHRDDDAGYERGRGLHGNAFMSFRGWINPVVKAVVEDPRDETPYWIFSTRRPEQLVGALGGRMVTQQRGSRGVITAENQPAAATRYLPKSGQQDAATQED